MDRETERYREFARRSFLIGGMKIALLSALGTRLAYLQVFEADKYKTLSDKNRISLRLLPAGRGLIVDRFGVPLALNEQSFRVFFVAEQSPDMDKTLSDLTQFIDLSEEELAEILVEIEKKPRFSPVMVKENITWDQMAAIEVHLPDLPGVSINVGKIRTYPFKEATAHLVGYVGVPSQSELTGDPVMLLPGFRIGKTGIEKFYDDRLRGVAGATRVEVNAVGREIRVLERNEGQSGDRITLTIDGELQLFCQRRLSQEKSASCVIMDVHNGAIYALASSPGFDPNLFTLGISAEKWEEVLSDPTVPLTNKAISGQYPPGSTFKMVTALAALEAGVVTPYSRVFCPGHMEIGRDKFHCWKRGGHGSVDMVQAIAQSCDVYFYDVAQKLGIEKINAMAKRLGLGSKTGINIPGEAPGLIPGKDWKLARFGQRWQLGETVISAIGQGYLQTTPLQLAVMTSRLVNGGTGVVPRLVERVDDHPLPRDQFKSLGLNASHLKIILQGMTEAMQGDLGTARASRILEEGYSMGGKTGTAQVRRITREQRARGVRNEDLPWKYRHHALFVGFGPVENPRYACAVVVEHGVGGSTAAAPLARDILLEAQKRDPAGRPMVHPVVPLKKPEGTS